MRTSRTPSTRRRGNQPTPDEIVDWILPVDTRQPRDRLATTRNHNLHTPLYTLEMLAQSIMKLTHPYLNRLPM